MGISLHFSRGVGRTMMIVCSGLVAAPKGKATAEQHLKAVKALEHSCTTNSIVHHTNLVHSFLINLLGLFVVLTNATLNQMIAKKMNHMCDGPSKLERYITENHTKKTHIFLVLYR